MRLLLLVVACATLSACSLFMHSIERPTATVRNVSVSSAGLTGISGELQVDVMNPNDFGVPLSGIDWRLSIGGARALSGRAELSRTIPARGLAPITTSLTVDARDAIAVASVLASGARDYRLDATLHFATAVGQLDVAVQHAGTI
jgi:LEA14-like dessication related protein